MEHGQSLSGVAVRALAGMDAELAMSQPQLVLVQGTLQVLLLVRLRHSTVVSQSVMSRQASEAMTSRSLFRRRMNRQVIARVATLNFAPTQNRIGEP